MAGEMTLLPNISNSLEQQAQGCLINVNYFGFAITERKPKGEFHLPRTPLHYGWGMG